MKTKKIRTKTAILEIMEKATVPHCCYRMCQKFILASHKPGGKWMRSVSESDLCRWMAELMEEGYLTLKGIDSDGEWLYSLGMPEVKTVQSEVVEVKG